jgi:hypothetical protein
MRRTKTKPYWLIKEDRHYDQEWLRQNRKVKMRLHLTYSDLSWYKFKKPHKKCKPRYDAFLKLLIGIENYEKET